MAGRTPDLQSEGILVQGIIRIAALFLLALPLGSLSSAEEQSKED